MTPRKAADRLSVLMAEAEDLRALLAERLSDCHDVPTSAEQARTIGLARETLDRLATARYAGTACVLAVDALERAEREAAKEVAP